jgi:large subunit ribosomal protein L23
MSNRTTKHQLKKPVSLERAYTIIKSPVVTEKATMGSEQGKVTFKVALDASKAEIKSAVEQIFTVKVTAVNTSILKGKVKRFKNTIGKRSDVKKAIVTLAEGQTLEVANA